ncbi:MAG: DUF1080 domain-containing protein [Planctomycetota bacterium]|nr:MAG: DUF1080 domain-containing protein [Planctomycetota bacterium]
MQRTRILAFAVSAAAALGAGLAPSQDGALQDEPVGYTDTPFLPGGKWRVHDAARPVPPVVTPGATSGAPPSDAVVLFDGKNLSAWQAQDGEEAGWKLVDGAMEVNGTGSIQTRDEFGDCQLHVEWAAPAQPAGQSQDRGNSGVFLMGRYEIQVLDSFQNRTYADGQAAALYGQKPPDVNACRPPGQWQSYDIVFRAPRFEGEKLLSPARVTVLHNGVLVHDGVEILGSTAHRSLARYSPHPPKGPIGLQDHGNPVRYRNIWVRSLE